jgi:hypothetical protein
MNVQILWAFFFLCAHSRMFLIVSLLFNVGFPYATTVSLADISLVAIAFGLVIAMPEMALGAAVQFCFWHP